MWYNAQYAVFLYQAEKQQRLGSGTLGKDDLEKK